MSWPSHLTTREADILLKSLWSLILRLQAFSGLEVGFYPVLSEMPSRHMLNCRSQSRGRPGPCGLADPESSEESIVIEGISWHYGFKVPDVIQVPGKLKTPKARESNPLKNISTSGFDRMLDTQTIFNLMPLSIPG